ncbi:MAG: hypothetical protein EAZ85_07145 [Bacteroidetes bacterium]|nr:MAG: hypothetical protein EAZ85_07145 [Bacteroidota bacterium]TAG85515.1 MAG: hypothetical protein EAZ20_14890 [Bacteroidota bacterium]
MTKKQKIVFLVGLGVAGAAAYIWYKNKPPQFKIIDFNQKDKSVKWQYGNLVNISKAGQNNTYSNSNESDFYVNVGPIEQEGSVVGMRFNFLGKDQREPQFVYFQ